MEDEARQRKIEEGRRRLEKLRSSKRDGVKPQAAAKPLPSPFAMANRKLPEFRLPVSQAVRTPRQSATQENPRDGAAEFPIASKAEKVPDTKEIEDDIQRLRELDRSYTPHATAKVLAQTPAVAPAQGLRASTEDARSGGSVPEKVHLDAPAPQEPAEADLAALTVAAADGDLERAANVGLRDAADESSSAPQTGVGANFGTGREGQLQAAAAFAAIPEPAERVDAPPAADAKPYITDGVVFTSYPATSTHTSRTAFSIRREEGMRVDAMMGEAEGEDEKTIMIQSLRAMVDGLKRQIEADSQLVVEATQARKHAELALSRIQATGALGSEQQEELQRSFAGLDTAQSSAGNHSDSHHLPPSHFKDLQDSAEALKAMRAQKDALELDLAALLKEKHELQHALSVKDEAMRAEQNAITEVRDRNLDLERKLALAEEGAKKAGASASIVNGRDDKAAAAAAQLQMLQIQLDERLENVTDTVTEVARLRDNVRVPVLQEQMSKLVQSLDDLAREGFRASQAFGELDMAKREIENLRRAQEVANTALSRLQSQVIERGEQITKMQQSSIREEADSHQAPPGQTSAQAATIEALAEAERALRAAEEDKARLLAKLEEMAKGAASPGADKEAEQAVREEMARELQAAREALARAEEAATAQEKAATAAHERELAAGRLAIVANVFACML